MAAVEINDRYICFNGQACKYDKEVIKFLALLIGLYSHCCSHLHW
jgi:hypothetical protein